MDASIIYEEHIAINYTFDRSHAGSNMQGSNIYGGFLLARMLV